MFGEEWRIMAEFPHYFLDYRQELGTDERWQARITSQDDSWSGNVFDFYRRVFNNMKQAINVPFRLDENSERIDETEAHDALREALANCLTNADYNERRGVVFLWKEDGLHFANPGGFRVGLKDAYIGGNSDPRNETMMKMFTLISVGERAGGGIPDMVKKWTAAGYGRPVLSEQVNPERSSILLPLATKSVGNVGNVGNDVGNDVGNASIEPDSTESNVLRLIRANPKISAQGIADTLGMSKRHIERVTAQLRDNGVLVREGGTRGHWIIVKNL